MMVANLARFSVATGAFALLSALPLHGANLRGPDDTGSASGSPSSPFSGFSFGQNFLEEALSRFKDLLGPGSSFPSWPGQSSTNLSFSLPDDKSCRVGIRTGKNVTEATLELTVNTGERKITANYKQEQAQEEHDAEGKRKSFSAASIHSSSTVVLPEHCVTTTATLLSHLGGYLIDFADDSEERHGQIIFPSIQLLREYVEQGALPPSIIDTVTEGDVQQLGELTPRQRCLAAGFTTEDCQKLGDQDLDIPDVGTFSTPDAIPIPRYNISPKLLN